MLEDALQREAFESMSHQLDVERREQGHRARNETLVSLLFVSLAAYGGYKMWKEGGPKR